MPYANAGRVIVVHDTEGTDHTPADYEDIDNAKPIVPPPDIMFANMISGGGTIGFALSISS